MGDKLKMGDAALVQSRSSVWQLNYPALISFKKAQPM